MAPLRLRDLALRRLRYCRVAVGAGRQTLLGDPRGIHKLLIWKGKWEGMASRVEPMTC